MTRLAKSTPRVLAFPPSSNTPAREPQPMAAKMVVHLPHISWRDGRPRFQPGPFLRKLGLKGRDLRHEDGTWFTAEEAKAEASKIEAEIRQRKGATALKERLPPPGLTRLMTTGQMIAAMLVLPEMLGEEVIEGRRRRKGKSPATRRYYENGKRLIEAHCADVWERPARAVSAVVVEGMLKKIEIARGLTQARCARATLSSAFTKVGKHHGIRPNPVRDAEELPTPPGRTRAGTLVEMAHLIATCDAQGRPEIGDSILLGLMTTQRQNDRLSLKQEAGGGDGRLRFRQLKTGKMISIGPCAPLSRRLAAAMERRRAHTVQWPHLVIDEKVNRPFLPDHYRHVFAEMRDKAAETMASLADFRDQDLRDTAITWLRDAGADFDQRRALSGHAASSRGLEEKHYLAEQEGRADVAVSKLLTWLDAKGAKL
jgi:hypothetical protein